MTSKTIKQITNNAGFPKPAELIELTGHYALEATDRAIFNLLYKHAHDTGKIAEDITFEIPLKNLREEWSEHESNDRLIESLKRIMGVTVTVPYTDDNGEKRILLTHLFDAISLPAKNKLGILKFSIPRELKPIITKSGKWGRISAKIVCSMTSKYAISLYELIQLRANRDYCVETFTLERFRELMGVPPKSFTKWNNFERKVLNIAELEVNGLSEYGVKIGINRKNNMPKGEIIGIVVTWWQKEGDEYRETLRELRNVKVGRKARLLKAVEEIKLI